MDHSTPKEDPFANQACTNIYLSTYPYILTTLQFRILLDVMSHIHRERHSVRKHVWPGHGQTQAFTTHRVPELVAVERLQLSIEGGPRGLRLLNGLQKRLDFARRLHLASSWQYSSAFFFLICSGCTERERECVCVCVYIFERYMQGSRHFAATPGVLQRKPNNEWAGRSDQNAS